jgi:hypothetical protein
MQARALAVALRLLSLACAGAALGSLTACPYFFSCPDSWSEPETIAFTTEVDLIGVGPGTDYDSYVAVGLNGLISSFDGETAMVASPVNVALRAIARRDTRLLAVGDQGTIVISDDAGQTWSPRTSGTTGSLIAIVHAPLNSGDVIVAVGVEAIVVSADMGETWSVVPEPATGWGTLRGVFATKERVYAVGDGGVAWSSESPGGLWNIETLGTSANLLGGGPHYADSDSWVNETETLLVAASDNTVILRDSEGWRVRSLDLEGTVIGISGGYLLTSAGVVYDLDGTGIASRLPVTFDFAVKAIHADVGGVIVVGEGGQAQRAYEQQCVGGRPLIDQGESVVASLIERDDWLSSELASRPLDVDRAEADRWASAGLDEHASVGSFAVHLLELASLAAPAELLAEVQRAMADEVRHAELCFGLAHRFGVARGPGPLVITPTMLARCGDPRAIALALLQQGCVNETLAACEASVSAQTCDDPEARQVLEQIADDERRHAALAWKSLRWLVERNPELRAPLRRRLTRLAVTSANGIQEQTLRALILPLARTLLASDEVERPAIAST